MPRFREFDLDTALDAAMERFWQRGYEATSMADLLEAIGIHKGSLYKAFGDKHSLYLAALERYLEQSRGDLSAAFTSAPSAREALGCWLREVAERCVCQQAAARGCFAVNAVVELAPHDEEVRHVLRQHTVAVEKLVANTIQRGQERGEFSHQQNPIQMARFLATFVFGLSVRAKVAPLKQKEVNQLVAAALSSLS